MTFIPILLDYDAECGHNAQNEEIESMQLGLFLPLMGVLDKNRPAPSVARQGSGCSSITHLSILECSARRPIPLYSDFESGVRIPLAQQPS
jgi:hypothetical protein